MNSPGHRANILNPNYDVIGIGIEIGDFDGWEAVRVTQNFARTSADLQMDSSNDPAVNSVPVVTLGSFYLTPGGWFNFSNDVLVQGANGETPVKYKVRDPSGLFELAIDGQTLSPRKTYKITAKDFDSLTILTDETGIKKIPQIRASDGKDWSAWEQFHAIAASSGDRPLAAVENLTLSTDQNQAASLSSGLTNASSPYRIDAEDLAVVLIQSDGLEGKSKLQIRAFDGEDLSKWETFATKTVAEDDPLILA